MDERETISRGWYYVVEPDADAVPVDRRLVAGDGRVLTRRAHGYPGRVEVRDEVGLPVAVWLRAAAAVGAVLEERGQEGPVRVVLGTTGPAFDAGVLRLQGAAVRAAVARFVVEQVVRGVLPEVLDPVAAPRIKGPATPRVLFFESLMNTDMPHNDTELSQGVLHLISALRGSGTEVVLADVKMPIEGDERPVWGLDRLDAALAGGRIGLVCITLLEGYWDGVLRLIAALRERGCRARIAVGGVMPSLAPEHVAAHLPEVSFVCRGAGEVFLPRLVAILGDGDEDTPLTVEQRAALLQIDGMIAIDRVGHTVLAAAPSVVALVPDLDRVPLDLSWVTAHHVQGGIELATSRGCIHRCTFCSILGRESYQARSAGSVIDVLETYEARFGELFGDDVPPDAYRVHFSDDDFACDKPRAIEVMRALGATPFRLSSVQVSVADLCRREGRTLLPELDPDLLDAFRPERFADHGRPIPERDHVEDFRSRAWSSFLQLGVESYCDAELIRLGKGYRREHVRAVVLTLARRRLHMDGYFILANADTAAEDLIDVLDEVCRLKLQVPRWFHVRFPIVPRLVSYFTAASHRRLVRQGRTDRLVLRGVLTEPGIAEYDYPLVDHDEPEDPWVAMLGGDLFTDAALYTGSLVALRERWLARLAGLADGPERLRGEQLVRRLDDRPRRVVFEVLATARRVARGDPSGWPGGFATEAEAVRSAERVLGPAEGWLETFRRYDSTETPRLVVIPTWQCELRCGYCFIPKQDGRVMRKAVLERAIGMLLASDREELMLQFFGGEALLEWELVQHGIATVTARAAGLGKRVKIVLSSNGWSIDAEKLAWLARYPVRLELSLDGDREVQNLQRRAAGAGQDSYDNGIAHRAAMIRASGLEHEVIMVVHPKNVDRVAESFFHIVGLGFARVQINFALGFRWTQAQQRGFAAGLHTIGQELRRRWARGEEVALVNLLSEPLPIRLNAEVTVDWDGTVYGGNGFLHETEHKDAFRIGHLDDLACFDRYWMDAPSNEFLLRHSYPEDVTANNLAVGAIATSFIRWMRRGGIGPEPAARTASPLLAGG